MHGRGLHVSEIATAQRNALLQRDDALVTRWWSSKLKLQTLLVLAEFHFGVRNASRSFFHGANALALAKKSSPSILFPKFCSKKQKK